MKHSMEKHATEKINSRQGILPLVLTILLLITAVLSIVKIAQSESESESETIASFAVPVTELTVQVGTEKTAIPLPTEVEAVTESGGTAIIPVTWEDGGLFDKDTPGTYVFTADIGAHIYPDARPIAVVTVAETIPEASISGGLWLDANADGIMDADETGVADYPVSLYAESDLSAALLNTQTDADGTYRFENLAQGSYVVGVASETIEGTTYMPPTIGLSGDNKFTLNEDGTACYSDAIAVAANTAAENINAGVRRLELPIMALGVALIAPQNTSHVNKPLGGNTIKSGDETELVVMEADGDPSSGYYQAYTANIGGLRDALWGIYQRNQPSVDYIMYFGANITVSGSTNLQVFNNTSSATGAADVTFASLSGKLNTLVLTGTKDDPISTNPATANPSSTYGLNASGGGKKYFGCNLIFRNTRYQLNTGSSSSSNNGVYMNGYDLTLGGGSWHYSSDVYFYGGSDSGTVAPADGTASITVYSTGNSSYASYFIGGMRTGTLEGNAEISIHNTSGNDIYIYGGGLGTSSTVVADITGNVTNTITGMASNANGLSSFIGGVAYGTVGGSITNTISGTGRAKSSASFVGGSESGDIGGNATKGGDVDTSDLNTTAGRDRLAATNDYVIKNIIDTSEFTSGRISYIGTNEKSGIITGNVVNIVKAGTDDSGSFSSMSGGSGSGAQLTSGSWLGKFMVTSTDTSLDITDIDAGLAAAKSVAEYQLYGNITNIVRAGNICNGDFGGWFRGAGWGYMEGNAYSEVGTEGVVYRSDRSSYKYDPKTRTQGYLTSFDLVGGGGTVLNSNHFCIKGDTTLILREVVARWTYGSNFAGVQIGNSKIALYGGVVDTLEGTGRDNDIHVGDGRAEVHGGQVDWFLSGGGYDDDYQLGNVSVEVYDEPDVYVNASMGGTYGYSNPHYISGDSTIVVRGGNFSGTARDSPTSGFSAGPSNHGYIFGNAAVTLDLRGNEHGFSIEKGDSISGGRRLGADSDIYLGATEANTITLTILADESAEDLLNGLNIYGDCKYNINNGTNADNTRAGKIIININAPGANIGNVYATNYPNITSASVLRRDVQINLVSAKTIMGLSAGNEKDDITDTVFANSVKVNRFAVINVGPRSDDPDDILYDRETGDTEDGLPHRINVSTNGINGFTTMNIARRLLIAQTGNIKNGANATPANHGSYNTFGTVFLEAGEGIESSGIGIESDNAVFIAGHAVVRGDGKAYIESTGKPDQIVFTSVTVMESDSALTWLKVGTQAEANGLLTGWFGATSGWRVITVNPRPTDVGGKITPVNFGGLEATTGKTFIGDYDTHFGDGYNDYVVAIPGSVYTWEVTAGEGTVSHNAEVSTTAPPSGTTITAYGTVQKDTPTKEGSIVIPGSATVLPTFTFTPEASYEEWVKSVDIVGSDQYTEDGSTHTYTIARGDPKEAKTWKPDSSKGDNLYSFDIEAKFSSEAEVFANNVIITAEEAKTITQDEIIDYTDANGRPFFTNNIGEVLNPIKESLDSGQKWRTHSVTFTAGDADVTGTTAQKTVLIIVVTDDMAVSSDRQCAVYAEDATIGLSVAQAMTSKTDVNAYTDAFVLLSDGTTTTATMDNALSEFTSLTEETLSKDGLVPVQYIYTTNTKEEVDKWVVVTVVRDDVNLTVSNTVTGDYADRTKDFTFTVTLWSSSNALFETGKTISFTGGTIGGSGATAPADGTLTVGSNGEVTFNLKHGQTVTLAGVSATGYVQIVESARENYSATIFTDSADADGNTYDTGKRLMTGVDRTFSFENARNTVVPTGVITGNPQRFILPVLFLLLMSALGAGLGIRKFYLRHRRNR